MSAAPIFPHTITPWQSMPDKDAVIAHYAEQERQAYEEARIARNAAMWEHLMDVGLDGIREALDHCETVGDFMDYVYEAITDDTF